VVDGERKAEEKPRCNRQVAQCDESVDAGLSPGFRVSLEETVALAEDL